MILACTGRDLTPGRCWCQEEEAGSEEDRRERDQPQQAVDRRDLRTGVPADQAQLEDSRHSVQAGDSDRGTEPPADLPGQVVVEDLPEADPAGDLCSRHWAVVGEELPGEEDTGRTAQAGTGRGRAGGDLRTVLREEEWSSLAGRERTRQVVGPRR